MEHEGIYYWFEHSEGNHLMVLGDHFSTHEPYPGYATVPWYPPDQTFVDKDHFYAWRQAREVESGKYVHTDYDFKKPPTDLTTELADPKGHLYDQYEVFDFPGGYTDPGFGQHYAAVRLQALQADQDRVQGQGLVRGAAPGYRLTLDKHPRKDQNRELLIVRATYQIANNDYEGAGGSGQSNFEVAIEAMPAQTQFRPRRTTPKPHTLGPETAQVVGPAGEEIYTNEHGQVKVKFHWDRYGKKDGTDSCWIRVSHPWAGSNYGGIHIPRIGQEVIIDFLNGDPDYPIITGRVYNASQMPPWKLPANKTQSGFLTRSTKGGASGDGMRNGAGDANALRFEDKKGDEQVWFHAQKDYLTEVEHDESKWVGNDRHKEIDRDETTEVHRHRTETVDGNETITIHMNRTETVDLNETITIHQNRTERVDLNEQISIGVNRTEDVGANETVSIGSNRSVTIGANKSETVAIMKTETIGAAKMLSIGGLYQTTVGAAMNTSVVLAQAEQIGLNKSVNVGKAHDLTVGTAHEVKVGTDFVLEAGDSITLKVGESVLVMKKDGTVTVNGKDISVIGTGDIAVKASGTTTVKGAKIHNN